MNRDRNILHGFATCKKIEENLLFLKTEKRDYNFLLHSPYPHATHAQLSTLDKRDLFTRIY